MKINSKEFTEAVKNIEPLYDYNRKTPRLIPKELPQSDFLLYSRWSEGHLKSFNLVEELKINIVTCDIDYHLESAKNQQIKTLPFLRLKDNEYIGNEEVLKALREL